VDPIEQEHGGAGTRAPARRRATRWWRQLAYDLRAVGVPAGGAAVLAAAEQHAGVVGAPVHAQHTLRGHMRGT
jgi:hypothetical protein